MRFGLTLSSSTPPLLASVGHLLSLHTPRSGTEGTEVEECNGGTEGDRGPAGCVRWERAERL